MNNYVKYCTQCSECKKSCSPFLYHPFVSLHSILSDFTPPLLITSLSCRSYISLLILTFSVFISVVTNNFLPPYLYLSACLPPFLPAPLPPSLPTHQPTCLSVYPLLKFLNQPIYLSSIPKQSHTQFNSTTSAYFFCMLVGTGTVY